MGYLMDRLAENRLYSAPNFNLMLASGHGMANIKKIVFINEYILESDAKIWSFSQTLIHLKPLIDLNTLLMKLSRIPGVSVTLRENLPQRLNYRENDRIADIIISAVEGNFDFFLYFGPKVSSPIYNICKQTNLTVNIIYIVTDIT